MLQPAPMRGPAMRERPSPETPDTHPAPVHHAADGEEAPARELQPFRRMSTALVGPTPNVRSHAYKDPSNYLG